MRKTIPFSKTQHSVSGISNPGRFNRDKLSGMKTPLSGRHLISSHHTLWIALLIVLTLFTPGHTQNPAPLDGIDAYIETALTDWNIPGLAIAVVKDDKVVLAKGYGVREINKPEPVDANTVFVIASNGVAIRTRVDSVSRQKREASGVKVIGLEEGVTVSAFAPVANGDE